MGDSAKSLVQVGVRRGAFSGLFTVRNTKTLAGPGTQVHVFAAIAAKRPGGVGWRVHTVATTVGATYQPLHRENMRAAVVNRVHGHLPGGLGA